MTSLLLALALSQLSGGAVPDFSQDIDGVPYMGMPETPSVPFFRFAPKSGQGLPTAVPLCSAIAPSELVGSWFCVDGDSVTGTNSAATGGPMVNYGVGQTDTVNSICPNGAMCGVEKSRRWTAGGAITATGATTNGTTGVTFCVVFDPDVTASNPDIYSHGTSIAAANVAWAILRQSGTFSVYASDGVTRDTAGVAGVTSGVLHIGCGLWSAATGLRACLDGVCSAATAHAAMQALTVKDTMGGYNGVVGTEQLGRSFGNLVTYTDLGNARVQAIQHAVLADQPIGLLRTSTVASTYTRAGIRGVCADAWCSAASILPANRVPITQGGYDGWAVVQNKFLRSEEYDNAINVLVCDGGAVCPTVTANAGVSPAGTTTADRVQVAACSVAGQRSLTTQAVTVTASAWDQSVWVRSWDGGVVTAFLGLYDSTANAGNGMVITTPSDGGLWQRYDFSRTFANTTATVLLGCENNAVMLLADGGANPGNTGAADLLVWGGQTALGAYAYPYSPTSNAAASTAADVFTFPNSVVSTFQDAGVAGVTVTVPWTTIPGAPGVVPGGNGRVLEFKDVRIGQYDGTTEALTTSTMSPNVATHWAMDWGLAGKMDVALLDGGTMTTNFDGTMDVSGPWGPCYSTAIGPQLNGVCSNFCLDTLPTSRRCRQ